MKTKNKKNILRLLIVVILLGTFLRLYESGTDNLTVDEALYAKIAKADSIAETIDISFSYDKHPVLLHLLFRVWGYLGDSEFILRSVSVIFGVLSIVMIYLTGKILFNERIGLLSALILSIAPEHIRYSQEFRPYALVVFIVLVSFYFFLKALKENKNKWWILYVIFTIICVYLEYLSALYITAIAIFVFFFWKKYKHLMRRFIISEIFILIFSVPLVFIFLVQATVASHWAMAISRLSPLWKFFIIPYNFLVFTVGYFNPYMHNFALELKYVPFLVLIFSLIGFFFIKGVFPVKERKEEKFLLLLFLFFPLLAAYIASSISYFSLDPFHFLFVTPAYYILIAKGIFSIKNKKIFISSVIFIILVSLISIHSYYLSEKTSWKEIAEYIHLNSKSNDVIGIVPNSIAMPFNYYYKGDLPVKGIPCEYLIEKNYSLSNIKLEAYNLSKMIVTEENFQLLFNKTLKKYSRMWFISTYSGPQGIEKEKIITDLLDKRGVLLSKKIFSEKSENMVGVYLYDLNVSSILKKT